MSPQNTKAKPAQWYKANFGLAILVTGIILSSAKQLSIEIMYKKMQY